MRGGLRWSGDGRDCVCSFDCFFFVVFLLSIFLSYFLSILSPLAKLQAFGCPRVSSPGVIIINNTSIDNVCIALFFISNELTALGRCVGVQ